MKIVIIGAGYVGLGNALLLAQNNEVLLIDTDPKKVRSINAGISPIEDDLVSRYLKKYQGNVSAIANIDETINSFKLCIIATPTNFKNKIIGFDTSTIDKNLSYLKKFKFKNPIVIRSTIPIGYTESAIKKYKDLKISFFPEFLREGYALHDNLYPSRIIAGGSKQNSKLFAGLLKENAKKKDVPTLFTSPTEAEAIKLFSNTYLAMRISFFNELDSFAMIKNLNTENIINGIGLDDRIGNFYNNPSFGYGGYCLPKDTKQLASNFSDIPHYLIKATIKSNIERKKIIAKNILHGKYRVIGIYRLTMKSNSDNFRESAINDVIKILKKSDKEIIIYEPNVARSFLGCKVENNFEEFLKKSDVIVANRVSKDLEKSKKIILTRDIFNEG